MRNSAPHADPPRDGGIVMWLLSLGRPGGALALAFGLAALWGTHWDIEHTGGYWLIMPAVGVALSLYGALLLLLGNGENRPLKEPAASYVAHDLLAKLQAQPLPYWFCARCREVVAQSRCTGCASGQFTSQVRRREDVPLVLAQLHDDGR